MVDGHHTEAVHFQEKIQQKLTEAQITLQGMLQRVWLLLAFAIVFKFNFLMR